MLTNLRILKFKKPQVTGAGPFIAIPEITPIGSHAHSAKIELPQGTILRSSDLSLIAHNNEGNTIITRKVHTGKIDYSESVSKLPTSLILSALRRGSSLHMLRTEVSDEWKVTKPEYLRAWTGGFPTYEDNYLHLSGERQILLEGQGSLFCVILKDSEKLVLEANVVVAFKCVLHTISFQQSMMSGLMSRVYVQAPGFIRKIFSGIGSERFSFGSTSNHRGQLLTLVGPATLIIKDSR